jgi:hypothetical protein
MASYWEQLKHPMWQKKRLEILQRFEFCCQKCYDTESTLHVHHKRYLKGRAPWEYDDDNFTVLCETCHEDVTSENERIKAAVARCEPDFLHDLACLIELAVADGIGIDSFELHGICAGYVAASGDPKLTGVAAVARARTPVLFHYGVLARILSHDRHRDGQASREAALIEHSTSNPTAWELLGKGFEMLDRLDSVEETEREHCRYVMKAQRSE